MEVNFDSRKPIVYLVDSSLITPLGRGVESNMNALLANKSGIAMIDDARLFKQPLPLSKINDLALLDEHNDYLHGTRYDTLILECAKDLKSNSKVDFSSKETLIILSTTKGNIELIEEDSNSEALRLNSSAKKLQLFFNNPNEPLIVSNACISGISAFIVAKRLLQSGMYKSVVIIGADVLSKFVISGFNSFHAISKEPCKPFDAARTGVSMGEAAAGVILSTQCTSDIEIGSGFISNDSNHISGPSKTGEELSCCIQEAMKADNLTVNSIDFICAHGTATLYNDEMESLAIERSGLGHTPLFSLKANYGHTLGASGVLELIITSECLQRNTILPSLNFTTYGVSGKVNVNPSTILKPLRTALKTGSGFGGCNAAIILNKLM